MNVRELGSVRELDNGFTEFRFRPERIYPAIIERIKAVLSGGEVPVELVFPEDYSRWGQEVDFEARNLLMALRLIPARAWENALRPRSEFNNADIAVVIERRNALEAALSWLTLACRVAATNHHAMIYIEHNPDFQL